MAGPYFERQLKNPCGCYYPDVTRIGDDAVKKETILYCINHGEYRIPASPELVTKSERIPIPNEEWREAERKRIRSDMEEGLKATCRECGYFGHPSTFDTATSAYHDLKCPNCGTTNIDWDYADYKGNTLVTERK